MNDDEPKPFVYRGTGDLKNLETGHYITCLLFGRHVDVIPEAEFVESPLLCEVLLPPYLKSIGSLAFVGCPFLERVSPFPSSLLTIGRNAFAECSSLKHVELNEGLLRIEDEAFLGCQMLEGMNIPSSVKFIGVRCFGRCKSIKFFEFGSNVDEIGDYAFQECEGMTVARLPPSIRTLNRGTFEYCKWLRTVELPLGLKHVRQDAFRGCELLHNLALPSSVEPNGEDPFHGTVCLNHIFPPRIHSEPRKKHIVLKYEACVKKFYGYPIHECCYKQSFLSLAGALESIDVALGTAPRDAACLVDRLGMTVFHVLALSSKPRINLFQILKARCPQRLMEMKNEHSMRPLGYLCDNSSVPSNTRKILVDYLAQVTILERASKLGLLSWRTTVIATAQEKLNQDKVSSDNIDEIYGVLEHYERREILSLLELTIWRWNLLLLLLEHRETVMMEDSSSSSREQKRPKLDERKIARVHCGADIIIANVIPFYSSTLW